MAEKYGVKVPPCTDYFSAHEWSSIHMKLGQADSIFAAFAAKYSLRRVVDTRWPITGISRSRVFETVSVEVRLQDNYIEDECVSFYLAFRWLPCRLLRVLGEKPGIRTIMDLGGDISSKSPDIENYLATNIESLFRMGNGEKKK